MTSVGELRMGTAAGRWVLFTTVLGSGLVMIDGTVVTHPATNLILAGITRGVVLELARAADMRVAERAIQVEEIGVAEELFFTGATGEVRPCVQVDGKPVGDGRVGPVTRALSDAFLKLVERTKREGRRSTKETAAIAR